MDRNVAEFLELISNVGKFLGFDGKLTGIMRNGVDCLESIGNILEHFGKHENMFETL